MVISQAFFYFIFIIHFYVVFLIALCTLFFCFCFSLSFSLCVCMHVSIFGEGWKGLVVNVIHTFFPLQRVSFFLALFLFTYISMRVYDGALCPSLSLSPFCYVGISLDGKADSVRL